MTGEVTSGASGTLHPTTTALAEALCSRRRIAGRNRPWRRRHLARYEEVSSTITFVEAQGDELRIVPFIGDADAIGARTNTSP